MITKKSASEAPPPPARPSRRPSTLARLVEPIFKIGRTIKEHFAPGSGPPPSPGKVLWRSHVPELARRMADMIDVEPTLFGWLTFGAVALRELDGEVHLLTQVRSFLGGVTEIVDGLLNQRRTDLYEKTRQVLVGMEGIQKSPLTSAEVKERLGMVSRPVYDLLGERNKKIGARRRSNQRLAGPDQRLGTEAS